ncbi:MAG: putative toxin-antitoxin system toxin component, PIN family [Prevotella sp.]|nr:putative toxin-antitoxin system toxin component, PIN family [Prevotella sp.]
MIYAVIDTNVLVSALFTNNIEAATVKVLEAMLHGRIIPLYNEEIFDEYEDVLNRSKFHFSKALVDQYLEIIYERGILCERVLSSEYFPDPKDVVFYEVALSKDDSYLVTGNIKHFPKSPIVVTPAEMMQILERVGL